MPITRINNRFKLSDGVDPSKYANVDNTHLALETMDIGHYKVHEGKHFTVENFFDNASTTNDILFKIPSVKFVHLIYNIEAEQEYQYDWYEGTTVSADGAAVTIFNNNRNSATTSGITLFTGPTVTTPGTIFHSRRLGSGKVSGGSNNRESEIILKQNTNYLLRLTRIAAGTVYINYQFEWYENV